MRIASVAAEASERMYHLSGRGPLPGQRLVQADEIPARSKKTRARTCERYFLLETNSVLDLGAPVSTRPLCSAGCAP